MNPPSPRRRLAGAATTAVLSLGLLAGCGGEEDPLAPLYETLGQIDDSIVDGEYDRARDQVADLLRQVSQARTDGDMTKAAASRIRDAAKELRSRLADQEDADDEPTETPTTPPTTDSSSEDDEKEREKAEREAEKERKEREKEAEKERKEREKQTPTRPTRPAPTTAEPTTEEPEPTDPGTSGDGEGDTSGSSSSSSAGSRDD